MMRLAGAIFAAMLMALTGCRSGQPTAITGHWDGTLPSYQEVAKAYNERVDPLTRLHAAIVLRLDYRDEDGAQHHEQVEGSYDFVRPRQASLFLTKAGQQVAVLGSDQRRFWWIELADRKRAMVGDHDKVGVERLAAAGVPVHPLDLIELLGITPLPTEPGAGQVSRSSAGELIVTVPGRFGSIRVIMPERDYRPGRIELLGKDDKVASAVLSKYEVVAMAGAGPGVVHPVIATDAVIAANKGETTGHLELASPVIDPSRPKPQVFDLDALLRSKDVVDVVHIDDAKTGVPSTRSGSGAPK